MRRAGSAHGQDRRSRAPAEADLQPAFCEVILEDESKALFLQTFFLAQPKRELRGSNREAQLIGGRPSVPHDPGRPMYEMYNWYMSGRVLYELYISYMFPGRMDLPVDPHHQRGEAVEHGVFAGQEDLSAS